MFYPSVISFESIAFFSGAVIAIKQQMKGHHCFLTARHFSGRKPFRHNSRAHAKHFISN
jgi:hypothetical protein